MLKRGRRRGPTIWFSRVQGFGQIEEHSHIMSGKHSRTNSSNVSSGSYYNSSSDDDFASDRKSVGSLSGYSSNHDGNVFI